MTLFRRPRYGWLHSGLMAVAVGALAIILLVVWLPRVAGAAIQAPDDGTELCYEQRERVLLEHERNVVISDEVTVAEQLFQKQIKVHGRWQDYPGVTRWESPDFTEEGWIAGVRYRYRAVEGETRTVVISPAVTERQVEWFDGSPPEDGWTPPGRSEVTFIDVEVPCPEEPPMCACPASLGTDCTPDPDCPQPEEPPVDEPACPGDPECPAPPGPEEPPVDHGPEPEADHTDTPPTTVLTNEDGEPILPVTGPDADLRARILGAAIVAGGTGGTLLGIGAYDRHKRRRLTAEDIAA